MKRLEPNLLLAVTTGFALALLVMTSSVYGGGDGLVRNTLLAVICAVVFAVVNPWLMRLMKRPDRPPLIHRDVGNAVAWAAIFPAAVFVAAIIPLVFPGPDYGLLIICAAVWFGLTIESAIKARRYG